MGRPVFFAQQPADQRLAPKRDTLARDCRLNELIVVAEMQLAGGLEVAQSQSVEPQLPVEPGGTWIVETKQHVITKVGGRRKRLGAVRSELRAAYRKYRLPEQPPAAGRVSGCYIPYGKIHTRALQVDDFIRGGDAHIHPRMRGREACEPGNEPERGKSRGRGHDNRPDLHRDQINRLVKTLNC